MFFWAYRLRRARTKYFRLQRFVEPVTIPNLPGIHSYAFAQHEGRCLIIGGRRDGIHARQPFALFPQAANNFDKRYYFTQKIVKTP